MNKIQNLGIFLAIAGFLAVTGTGVDLVTSRTSIGLLLLGLGGVLAASSAFTKMPLGEGRAALSAATCLGSGYFIWRALSGGPIGLGLPDVVLVLIGISTYLAVVSSRRGGRAAFIVALGIVCVVNVGVALFQEFTEQAFFVWEDSFARKKIVTGIFGHYNPLAGFSNGSIFFFLSYLLLGKKLPWRILSGILVFGILAALMFSGSRGGWLSLIGGGAIWLAVVLTYLKLQKSRYFGFTLVSGVTLTVVALATAHWRLQKLTNERQTHSIETLSERENTRIDDGGRLEFQQLAFEIFQDHPAIGAGPRAYSYLSLKYWDRERRSLREKPPVFAHNEYLQVLADYGLLGLLIVIGLIFLHVISGVFSAASNSDNQDDLVIWKIGAVGGMASILGQCFFSFLLHVPACMALLGLQMGFLASSLRKHKENKTDGPFRVLVGLRSSFSIGISVVLMILGVMLAQSYFLSRKASRQLASASDEKAVFVALETMKSAGDMGLDPIIFEVMGRVAMNYANDALAKNAPEQAREFSVVAKGAFKSALSYQPNFPAGIAGLPRVEEALGNAEAAELGHQRAMKELWAREFRLRPHLYAAQSSHRSALRELYSGDKKKALSHFRTAHQRLLIRRELLAGASWAIKKDKEFRFELEAWIAFMEARLLFKEADDIWKNARPRNPELAYALMFEAQKRYQASEAVVREKYPNWEKQVERLELSLGYLQAGQVRPAKLSEEQIIVIIGSEEDLDSPALSR